jgi:hypothetical protein
VHGFAVGIGVGAGFLLLAAIVSAVFVTARPTELRNVTVAPASDDD